MTPTIIRNGQDNWNRPAPMTEWQRERAYGPVQPMVKERKWWRLWM